jgi:hypothetical protein
VDGVIANKKKPLNPRPKIDEKNAESVKFNENRLTKVRMQEQKRI